MSITQHILNFDTYFKTTEGDKIIVNDLNYFSIDDLETLNKSLMTIYKNTETLSIKPTCDCGETSGRFKLDKICKTCGTKCIEPHQKVKPLLWLKSLTKETKFLNPIVWLMISKYLDNKIDYLRYFCDTKYNPPVKMPAHIIGIKNHVLNNVRTYENTMANLENIFLYLLEIPNNKKPETQFEIKNIIEIITKHKDTIFSEYLPIINKKLFVVENTPKGKFINLTNSNIIDAVIVWLKACSEDSILKERQRSNIMGSVMHSISNLYYNTFIDHIDKKSGIFRKNIYGARSHFTFRNVIVSVPGKHKHDELHVPWCVGTTAFRPHLLNKLLKRGYKYSEASMLLFKSVKSYIPLIDELLKELISESKYRGIPVLAQRNLRG